MTYTEMNQIAANKFKHYTLTECCHAIADINDTLVLHDRDMGHPYVAKLYAELDAVRDRQMELVKKGLAKA